MLLAATLMLVGCATADWSGPTVDIASSAVPSTGSHSLESVASPSPSSAPSTRPRATPTSSPSSSASAFQSYPAGLPTDGPEVAAIIEGWLEYQRVRQKFLRDPEGFSDFTEAHLVATGEHENGIVDNVQLYRENRIRSLGGVSFHDVVVGESSATGEGGRSQVDLAYCVDRSKAVVVTYDGDVFPTDHLIPRFVEVTTMEQGADGLWRVARIRNGDEAC